MENDNKRPIGVFDSGMGGLTAVKELLRILPNEDIIYFGDTARVPYGSRSPETIQKFSQQDLLFLLNQNVKAVLVACGTVSSTAIGILRSITDIPIVGVIDAAALKAIKESSRKRVVVLATQATIRSHAFSNVITHIDADFIVIEKACPMFVPLIENGYTNRNNKITRMVVEEYLTDIMPFEADTVILGCTHYPLIKDFIQDYMPDVKIIEAGKEAANQMRTTLNELALRNPSSKQGVRRYIVSEKTDSFKATCEFFLGEHIEEKIEIVNFE